jgi:hypothetical protein
MSAAPGRPKQARSEGEAAGIVVRLARPPEKARTASEAAASYCAAPGRPKQARSEGEAAGIVVSLARPPEKARTASEAGGIA